MQFKKILFLSILTTLFISGCNSKNDDEGNTTAKEQTKFVLKTTDSKPITFEKKGDKIVIKELENKVILVNFWATWCPPCKAEIPHLINLTNKYKDNFTVLGIDMGGKMGNTTSKEDLDNFILEHQINYAITTGKENLKVAKLMGGINSIPTMFMINKKGDIIQEYVGVVPEEMIETDIKRALEE